MAQYKVLQDIEAEDKLLGPLSLRQFIYAAITLALAFITFRLFFSPVWFLGIIFVPPTIFFGLLAAPLGGQQSSEIWLLAKLRFFLKPRIRLWDQSGMQELVTITAPKKVEKHLTKEFSQDEVKSRLKTLSATLDTRGWAVKNSDVNAYASSFNQAPDSGGDRLLNINEQSAPSANVEPTADILDPRVNPRAQNMDRLIQKSAALHKDTIQKNIRAQQSQQATATPTNDEQNLLQKIHQQQAGQQQSTSHLKTILPDSQKPQRNPQPPVTRQPDPAILDLVKNSDGLSVESTAHLANRKKNSEDDEVVISLH